MTRRGYPANAMTLAASADACSGSFLVSSSATVYVCISRVSGT